MIRQIQYFQAIVKYQSFTKAAEELFISQSAISQQIKSLEEELGVKLLIRKNRSFELSEAGAYFYRQSQKLLQSFEQIKEKTRQISTQEKKVLKVGYLLGDETIQLKKAVAQFSTGYPSIQLQFKTGTHEQLYQYLLLGEVDLVLSDQRRAFSSAYVNKILSVRTTYVILAAEHPLAQRTALTKQDLVEMTCLILANREYEEEERRFFQEILEIESEIEFVSSLEEARLILVSKSAFLLMEGEASLSIDPMLQSVLYLRKGQPVQRCYCGFWKKEGEDRLYQHLTDLIKA